MAQTVLLIHKIPYALIPRYVENESYHIFTVSTGQVVKVELVAQPLALLTFYRLNDQVNKPRSTTPLTADNNRTG